MVNVVVNETKEVITRIQKAFKQKEEGIIIYNIENLDEKMLKTISKRCPFIRCMVSGDTSIQIVFDKSAYANSASR